MTKRIFAVFIYFCSFSVFSCTNALPTNNPGFCPSFKVAAVCYCTASGVPSSMCQNMTILYHTMKARFGTLKRACEHQNYTTTQDCIDNWNCYRQGGTNSRGERCSSTALPCE